MARAKNAMLDFSDWCILFCRGWESSSSLAIWYTNLLHPLKRRAFLPNHSACTEAIFHQYTGSSYKKLSFSTGCTAKKIPIMYSFSGNSAASVPFSQTCVCEGCTFSYDPSTCLWWGNQQWYISKWNYQNFSVEGGWNFMNINGYK